MSSIMFPYKNCASSSTGACDAFDDCEYWLASARNDAGSTASEVVVSCKNRPRWDVVRSESYSGLQVPRTFEWRLMTATVQPALASAR